MHTEHIGLIKTRQTTLIALLSAAAIVLQMIEGMIGFPFPLPGGKLGISNIVVLVAFQGLGLAACSFIIIVKSIAAGLLHSGLTSCIYALIASFAALWAMAGVKKALKERVTLVGCSVAGAFCFNVAQIIVAAALLDSWTVFSYVPFLTVVSSVAGCVTGILGELIVKRLGGFFQTTGGRM